MVRVKFLQNRIELVRPLNNTTEILIGPDYIKVGSEAYLEFEAGIDVLVHAEKEKIKDVSNNPPLLPEKDAEGLQAFGIRNPNEDLTNGEYIVRAIREYGKPFISVNEIKPILARNGYYSEAKDINGAMRYYLSTDERIVKNGEKWELKEWQERETPTQNSVFTSPDSNQS